MLVRYKGLAWAASNISSLFEQNMARDMLASYGEGFALFCEQISEEGILVHVHRCDARNSFCGRLAMTSWHRL